MTFELPCLYCGDAEGARQGEEHVLQEAFGTRLTIPGEVCDHCNTKTFSPLDGALVKYVRVYAYWDHPDVEHNRTMLQDGHGLWLQDGVWLNVRVDRDVKPIVFDQLVFLPDGSVRVALDSRRLGPEAAATQLALITTELATPSTLLLKEYVAGPPGEGRPAVQPALVRSAPGRWLLRAQDQGSVNVLREKLQAGTLLSGLRQGGDSTPRSIRPDIELRIEINFGSVQRALCKVALNLVCKVLGSNTARDQSFDDLRRYALTGNSANAEAFVWLIHGPEWTMANANLVRMFARDGHHTLVLTPDVVFVFLYSRPFAVVRLIPTSVDRIVDRDDMTVALFNYRTATHELIRIIDDPAIFVDRFGLPR